MLFKIFSSEHWFISWAIKHRSSPRVPCKECGNIYNPWTNSVALFSTKTTPTNLGSIALAIEQLNLNLSLCLQSKRIKIIEITCICKSIWQCQMFCFLLFKNTFNYQIFFHFSRFGYHILCDYWCISLSPVFFCKNPTQFVRIYIIFVKDYISDKLAIFFCGENQRCIT